MEDVVFLHRLQLDRYGGADGLRDRGLLESACAQPSAMFEGAWLHADLFDMASAYLFHIVANHPFVDGNKRTGLLAALTFLELQGVRIDKGTAELHDMMMAVASGDLEKSDIANVLRRLATTD